MDKTLESKPSVKTFFENTKQPFDAFKPLQAVSDKFPAFDVSKEDVLDFSQFDECRKKISFDNIVPEFETVMSNLGDEQRLSLLLDIEGLHGSERDDASSDFYSMTRSEQHEMLSDSNFADSVIDFIDQDAMEDPVYGRASGRLVVKMLGMACDNIDAKGSGADRDGYDKLSALKSVFDYGVRHDLNWDDLREVKDAFDVDHISKEKASQYGSSPRGRIASIVSSQIDAANCDFSV